jgi:hypothetical protein
MAISYFLAGVPVREDLPAAHRRAWDRLARAGAWWSGAERVAIAEETRRAANCALCAARLAALSPYALAGEHAATDALSAAAVDAVHRLTTDPGRLTRAWFDATAAQGLGDGAYVELLGVVVTVVSIDSFCRGIGVPPHPLPTPVAGEPTQARPPAARLDGAWVPMLPNGRRAGPEADLWGESPGGRTGNVIRALSLVPDEVRTLKDLSAAHYMTTREMMDLRSPRHSLDRRQVELIAGRVSALRGCFY